MGGGTAHDPGRAALVLGARHPDGAHLCGPCSAWPTARPRGLIGSVVGLLGLALRVPDHTTLSRRAATLEVPRPGRAAGGTDAGGEAEPMHLLVDSTGLKLCGAGEWLVEKHGTRTRRSWRSSISAWTPTPAGSWPRR